MKTFYELRCVICNSVYFSKGLPVREKFQICQDCNKIKEKLGLNHLLNKKGDVVC